MNYYKFDFEGVEYFLEIKNNYCQRAIFRKDNELFNTFLSVNNKDYILPEGDLSNSIEFFGKYSEFEFKKLWKKSIFNYIPEWERLKTKYKIGEIVKTRIICFYPQGIISNFGEFFNSLSDYDECCKKFGHKNMYPNKYLELEISDFDDENMIIKLQIGK